MEPLPEALPKAAVVDEGAEIRGFAGCFQSGEKGWQKGRRTDYPMNGHYFTASADCRDIARPLTNKIAKTA